MERSITGIIVLLALGRLAAPLTADAPPPGKVYRIGYLGQSSPTLEPAAPSLVP